MEAFLSEQADLPLDAGMEKEAWLFSVGPSEPLPADAAVRGALALARDAAAAVRPYLAVPVSAGAETLSGFERFKSLRSSPLSPEAPAQKPAKLPDHPALSGRTSLSSRPLAGSLVRVPDIDVFLAADEGGTLYAFDAEGTLLWRVRTGNRGDSRSYPVTYKGTVYYAGDAELLAVNGSDGAVLSRRALEPGRDPGARPSPFPDALLMSTAAGFDVLDPRSLEVKVSVPVAGGPGTLPTQRDSFALVVSKEGVLLLMDPAAGTVRAQVQTGARGFTAVSPRIFEERACFADRTGLVVMVDLERMKVLWERRTGVEVLSDIEFAREGILVYGNGRLFGFRPDGEPLMPPLSGVSAPPLLSNGTVYYGTIDGNLVVAQVFPWRIRGTLPLGDALSARPLQMGDTLYIGTRGGRLVRLDTSKLPL